MVEAEFDGAVLRARGTNKVGQVALRGEDRDQGDVVIPVDQIADVSFKDASMLGNGKVDVRTMDGKRYQLHFRKKSQAEFSALHSELVAARTASR